MSRIEQAQQINNVDEETRAISIVSNFLRQEDDIREKLAGVTEKIREMEKMTDREIIKKYSRNAHAGTWTEGG